MKTIFLYSLYILLMALMSCAGKNSDNTASPIENRVDEILSQMTLREKIGQMNQLNSPGSVTGDMVSLISTGQLGSVLNEANPEIINEMQRIALEESPHGIPLLFARDVIHGFKTIFPIPLGLASSFNTGLVKTCSEIAASEAWSAGINWTFAPMIDIVRDPRWGRVAESFGEDPYLVSELGVAVIKGFQGDDLSAENTLIACAKHFAGYGASEGGRDYNSTLIPPRELHDIYLPPFRAAVDAGVRTFMPGFNDLDGVPATGNAYLLREVLRDQWKFDGFVVSDWESTYELIDHGFAADEKAAAYRAVKAGVNMEMAAGTYSDNIADLVEQGLLDEPLIDRAVREILRVKMELGLFDNPYIPAGKQNNFGGPFNMEIARKAAGQSMVLLKNEKNILPLQEGTKIALIGPMANEMYEQLGTWNFDGDSSLTVTPLEALRERAGDDRVLFTKGLRNSRDKNRDGFREAYSMASASDIIVFCAGEEAIITGEAHSRAFLDLPGAQDELIKELHKTGKPVVLVILAGRPLTIGEVSEYADAVIYAWHPGTMGGAALADILYGDINPSGKLPVTFPKTEGQIPLYYNHKNTGRPVMPDEWVHIDDIPEKAFQTSLGNTSHYIDAGYEPLYPFGYGLSYTTFEYSDLKADRPALDPGDTLTIDFLMTNTGERSGEETAQLYIRDPVGNVTRPVRELKGFKRVHLEAGESKRVTFMLPARSLAFHDVNMKYIVEPGEFHVWVGGDSNAALKTKFTIKNKK
ncbi:MAG: glycoside hydrolase family 3 N-terminal domain-containing protein [Bacteroidales bacterium]